MNEKTSGNAERASGTTGAKTGIKLPATATVTAEKAFVFTVSGPAHVMERIGSWLPKDKRVKAVGFEDAVWHGEHKEALKIEVQGKRPDDKPQYFYLIADDVNLDPSVH